MTEEKLVRINEFKSLFYNQIVAWLRAQNSKHAELGETRLILFFERAFADAQPVDAAPIIHGRWQVNDCDGGDPGYYEAYIEVHCSECGYALGAESGQYGWYYGDPFPMHYCPNCGAKMDQK